MEKSRTLELIKRSGLDNLGNRWLTLSEICDNNIQLGYESSLSVIRSVMEVNVGDLCISGNFVGVVTEVYAGATTGTDLGLKGVKVRYEDVFNNSKGSIDKKYVEERIFLFGNERVDLGITTSLVNSVYVDVSSIKIVKRNVGNYEDEISKILRLKNEKSEFNL